MDNQEILSTLPSVDEVLKSERGVQWQRTFPRCYVVRAIREVFEAQAALFPNTMNDRVAGLIEEYRDRVLGWKLSGAGGGGYMVFFSDKPIPGAVRVIERRELY